MPAPLWVSVEPRGGRQFMARKPRFSLPSLSVLCRKAGGQETSARTCFTWEWFIQPNSCMMASLNSTMCRLLSITNHPQHKILLCSKDTIHCCCSVLDAVCCTCRKSQVKFLSSSDKNKILLNDKEKDLSSWKAIASLSRQSRQDRPTFLFCFIYVPFCGCSRSDYYNTVSLPLIFPVCSDMENPCQCDDSHGTCHTERPIGRRKVAMWL